MHRKVTAHPRPVGNGRRKERLKEWPHFALSFKKQYFSLKKSWKYQELQRKRKQCWDHMNVVGRTELVFGAGQEMEEIQDSFPRKGRIPPKMSH